MKSWPVALLALGAAAFALSEEPGPVTIPSWTAPPYWAGAVAQATTRDRGAPGALAASALPSAPLPFIAISPCRIVDTRGYGAPIQGGIYGASEARVYLLAGQCAIPSGAAAVSLNVTVTNAQGPGFILIHPAGTATPQVSTLNYVAGQTIANAAIVPLNASGEIRVVAGVSGTDLILDTNGYYAPIDLVNTVNTLSGDVTLTSGANVSITPLGNTLTIAAVAGGPPTGAAGGSLTGNYPNPAIATGAVGSAQLANATAVRSINGAAQDLVTIEGTGGLSVSTLGSTVRITPPLPGMTVGPPGDTTLIGAGYVETRPSFAEFWMPIAAAGAPSNRATHTAVWTGSRMIVWGGYGTGAKGDGARYDPVANAWAPVTMTDAPAARFGHVAVWTGSVMVVWGGSGIGYPAAGGRYDPVADSWSATTETGAPVGRQYASAVWTGTHMIVWGGLRMMASLGDGGRYDPVADSWSATSDTDAPAPRYAYSAVWTGSAMFVWGGLGTGATLAAGALYDPAANTWTPTGSTGAPSARFGATAVWAGSKVIVWGGYDDVGVVGSGALYDPVANTWTPTSSVQAPVARYAHTAVWTGSRMFVWGGLPFETADGKSYDPMTDAWSPITTTGQPPVRGNHTAVWTGSRMIVWGGERSAAVNDGGQLIPVSLYLRH